MLIDCILNTNYLRLCQWKSLDFSVELMIEVDYEDDSAHVLHTP